MTIKPGVTIDNLRQQIRDGLDMAVEVYAGFGLEAVVTSANDGKHGPKSLHYQDRAVDLRLPSRCEPLEGRPAPVPFTTRLDVAVWRDVKERLGRDYDVILETHQADRYNWHIHIEYDPKPGEPLKL